MASRTGEGLRLRMKMLVMNSRTNCTLFFIRSVYEKFKEDARIKTSKQQVSVMITKLLVICTNEQLLGGINN
jgi:hypothetical protein